jgi:hypothetical protein
MITPRPLGAKKHYFKMLGWGKTGVGKTLLAASGAKHPKLGKMAWLNIEDGTFTIPPEYDNDIIVYDLAVDDKGQEINVLDSLEFAVDQILAPNPIELVKGVQTIVIDSVSDLETKVQRLVAEANVKNSKGKRSDSDEMELRDYGISGMKLKRIFSTLRSCQKNVIFLATSKDKILKEKNQFGQVEERVIGVMPNLTAGVSNALVSYMDFSWYMYFDEKNNRVIRTTGTAACDAKTRRSDIQKAIGDKYILAPDAHNLANLMNVIAPFLDKQTEEVKK